MDDSGLPLKSELTSWFSVVAQNALQLAFGGGLERGVHGFDVVGFSLMNVRSTIETFGVGTRMEKPSSLPAVSGMTSFRALAAPVELGIMLSAAARARRRSLCGKSRITWSLV